MFRSLFGSLLNHLYRYGNENVSVRHLSLICITSILTTIYLLKNCSVYGRTCRIYCLKSFAFFRIEFRQVKKKKMLFASLGRSIMGKTVSEVLSAALRLRPQAVLKTEGTVFPNTDLPSGE